MTASPLSWRRDGLVCLALALVSFLVFNANMRAIPAVDTYAARYLPLSVWRNHTLTLEPILAEVAQGRDATRKVPRAPWNAFWIRQGLDGHAVSFYPILTPLAVAPLYLPAVLYLDTVGWDPQRVDFVARVMEKLSASLLAAISVALVYLLLRRRAEARMAVALAAVFAFGTTIWVVGSQALWMHGLGALLVAAAMLVLTGPPKPTRVVMAGLLCALIACNRQPDAVLALGLGLYGLWWAGRRAPLLVIAGLVPAGLLLAYNLGVVGNAFGAYALIGASGARAFLNVNPVEGFFGLLVSPARGLLVFSPFLLFLLFYLPRAFRDPGTRLLSALAGGAAVLQIVGYGLGDWRQGISWGPRWLTDMLPILIWMLPPVVAGMARSGRAAFGLACCVSVAIQSVGAFWYTGASDTALFAETGQDRTRAAWDIRNAAFIAELKHPPAPRDLFLGMRGNIDIARAIAAPDGTELRVEVEGWALMGSASPAAVSIRIDGREVAGTGEFFTRTDVVEALGENSPSGWRLAIPADQLAPGEHMLAALVLAGAGAEPRLLKQVTFRLDAGAARLAGAARRAAEWIVAQQQEPGYWLTHFTASTAFDPAQVEMNTYTQATLIDVAAPIAERAGLAAALARAKTFLSSQIEAGGLVRYHGLPDSPTIGILGCAITPDADDTALVWRLAPGPDPKQLQAALATLDTYRRPDGLYRTWLAPRDRYECLDPGNDPNPADIGIQINVLLLLAQADPPAAEALCAALRRHLDDDNVWVYYRSAPAMVAYRRPDLEKVGCPLDLPPARLAAGDAGQERWLDVIDLLQRLEGGERASAALAESLPLLQSLAADDFSQVRSDPPVIYHNDETATVSRYYWSQDVGFALWLRLYFAALQVQETACDATSASCDGT